MRNVVQGSIDKVFSYVDDASHADEIKRSSFESALDGIRTGEMTYKNDIILPMIETEMKSRLERFNGMTAAEEGALLSLSESQKKIVGDNDRKAKNEFLATPPHIGHGTVKANEKYI
jgi:hypothetical protein